MAGGSDQAMTNAFAATIRRSQGAPPPLVAAQPAVVPVAVPATPNPNRFMASTRDAFSNANTDVSRFLDKGEYSRAAGASLRQLVTVPLGIANDVVSRPTGTALGAVGRIIGGALGSDGSTTVAAAPTLPALTPAYESAGTAAGQSAGPIVANVLKNAPVNVQDATSTYLSNALKNGLTTEQAQRLGVGVPTAIKQPQTARDKTYDVASEIARAAFATEVGNAQEQAATDPKGARENVKKATDDYFNRLGGLLGYDPSKSALGVN